jgi:hypothetical protein
MKSAMKTRMTSALAFVRELRNPTTMSNNMIAAAPAVGRLASPENPLAKKKLMLAVMFTMKTTRQPLSTGFACKSCRWL